MADFYLIKEVKHNDNVVWTVFEKAFPTQAVNYYNQQKNISSSVSYIEVYETFPAVRQNQTNSLKGK